MALVLQPRLKRSAEHVQAQRAAALEHSAIRTALFYEEISNRDILDRSRQHLALDEKVALLLRVNSLLFVTALIHIGLHTLRCKSLGATSSS